MKLAFLFAHLFLYSIASLGQVEVITFNQLGKVIENKSEASLTVINFWATWCGPCIKELPHFEEVSMNPDVDVYLVSMDFIQDLDKVKRFVEKKELKAKVYLLDETDYDFLIPRISERWSGALPATLMIDQMKNKRHFFESAFTRDELLKEINNLVN